MQDNPSYRHAITDIIDFLVQQNMLLQQEGVNIIVDPGIGFWKKSGSQSELLQGLTKW